MAEPQMILLEVWAAKRYNPAPSLFTLRQWARDGEFWPPAEKVGRVWMVLESAKRLSSSAPGLTLVDRLRQA